MKARRRCDCMAVGFITTCAISAYQTKDVRSNPDRTRYNIISM